MESTHQVEHRERRIPRGVRRRVQHPRRGHPAPAISIVGVMRVREREAGGGDGEQVGRRRGQRTARAVRSPALTDKGRDHHEVEPTPQPGGAEHFSRVFAHAASAYYARHHKTNTQFLPIRTKPYIWESGLVRLLFITLLTATVAVASPDAREKAWYTVYGPPSAHVLAVLFLVNGGPQGVSAFLFARLFELSPCLPCVGCPPRKWR